MILGGAFLPMVQSCRVEKVSKDQLLVLIAERIAPGAELIEGEHPVQIIFQDILPQLNGRQGRYRGSLETLQFCLNKTDSLSRQKFHSDFDSITEEEQDIILMSVEDSFKEEFNLLKDVAFVAHFAWREA